MRTKLKKQILKLLEQLDEAQTLGTDRACVRLVDVDNSEEFEDIVERWLRKREAVHEARTNKG